MSIPCCWINRPYSKNDFVRSFGESSYSYIIQLLILCNHYLKKLVFNPEIFYNDFLICIQDCLQPLSMQALPTVPESLCIAAMGGSDSSESDQVGLSTYYLNIGLQVINSLVTK